ncbi:MAG: carbonic anhydrase [Sphingomonas sp.]
MTDFSQLIDGYRRFKSGHWATQRARWETLAKGQDPKVMVIACSDSRVDPTQIFDASPGEMFVVRNVANLVPPFETSTGYHGVSAALEFAVTQLEVPEILVMGHGACGGCKAALSQGFLDTKPGEGGFISDWISLLDKARETVAAKHGTEGPDAARAMEEQAVRVSLDNLRTFPWISEREAAGRLRLHGAYFAISDGNLNVLDPETDSFSPA